VKYPILREEMKAYKAKMEEDVIKVDREFNKNDK
jgi:hypothetical protein